MVTPARQGCGGGEPIDVGVVDKDELGLDGLGEGQHSGERLGELGIRRRRGRERSVWLGLLGYHVNRVEPARAERSLYRLAPKAMERSVSDAELGRPGARWQSRDRKRSAA